MDALPTTRAVYAPSMSCLGVNIVVGGGEGGQMGGHGVADGRKADDGSTSSVHPPYTSAEICLLCW